jgi:acetoin utilization protein AcuB
MTTAFELMTRDPVTVAVSAPVREAASLLFTFGFRHLPVVDDRKKLVGMVSDRDMRGFSAPYLIADEYVGSGPGALDAPVEELLDGDVLSVRPDSDLADVVGLMLRNRVGAVPVVDDEGFVMGIVSYVDILRALPLDALRAMSLNARPASEDELCDPARRRGTRGGSHER